MLKVKKNAHDEIRTRAGFPPADLESAALDRSATCAGDAVLGQRLSLVFIQKCHRVYEKQHL